MAVRLRISTFGEDSLGVGLETRNHAGFRSGGDDDFFASSVCTRVALDFHFAAAQERGVAGDAFDLGALSRSPLLGVFW